MNSATGTGAVALSAGALGSVIVWFCQTRGITPPPVDVAGYIAAAILYAIHTGGEGVAWIVNRYWPTPTPPATQGTPNQ